MAVNFNSGVSTLALLTAAALAAAPAQAQTYNWSGFYAGVHGGVARGHSDLKSSASCPPLVIDAGNSFVSDGYFCSSTNPQTLVTGATIAANASGAATSTAFNGGVQAGYNMQAGQVVYGAEVDFGSFGLKATHAASAPYGNIVGLGSYSVSSSVEADWLVTARGRLGWASSNLLLYVTGGLAVTELKVSNAFSDNLLSGGFTASGASSASKTRAGLALGAGAEWAFARNWTLKGEYMFVDFGSVATTADVTHRGFPGYRNGLSTKADLSAHLGRAGINYKF